MSALHARRCLWHCCPRSRLSRCHSIKCACAGLSSLRLTSKGSSSFLDPRHPLLHRLGRHLVAQPAAFRTVLWHQVGLHYSRARVS